MNWFPLVALSVLGACGKASRRHFPLAYPHSMPAKIAVVGHFAIGLLVAWISLCIVRSILIAAIAPSWHLPDLVLSPVRLFYFESWILLGAVIVEFWFLSGSYNVQDECRATLGVGLRTASVFIVLTTLAAIPVWWAIRPGEYGTFEGTIFHGLVTDRATAMFDTNVANGVSVDKVAWSQNARAIPDALVIATLLVSFVPLVKPIYRYFKMVLNDDYLHLPPKKKNEEKPQHNFPEPRGKRVVDEW